MCCTGSLTLWPLIWVACLSCFIQDCLAARRSRSPDKSTTLNAPDATSVKAFSVSASSVGRNSLSHNCTSAELLSTFRRSWKPEMFECECEGLAYTLCSIKTSLLFFLWYLLSDINRFCLFWAETYLWKLQKKHIMHSPPQLVLYVRIIPCKNQQRFLRHIIQR